MAKRCAEDDVSATQLVETCKLLHFSTKWWYFPPGVRVKYLKKITLFDMNSSDEVVVMATITLSFFNK